MDVDKALEVMASRGYPGWYDDVFYAGPVLAAEVKRLRVWKQRWRDIACKLRVQLSDSGTIETELEKTRMERDSWRRVAERLMNECSEAKDD